MDRAWLQKLTNERPTWCHLLFYFTYYVLNIFRTLIHPSSRASACVDELPHPSSCSEFFVCWCFYCGWYLVVFVLQAEVQLSVLQPANRKLPNTSRNKSPNTQRTENKTTDVVIHENSRKLLKMDILMSEACKHIISEIISKWHHVGLSFVNNYVN